MPANPHSPATAPPHLPETPPSDDPFGLGRWYTLVRGLDAAVRKPLTADCIPSLSALPLGSAQFFVDSAPRAMGMRSDLSRFTNADLPPGIVAERFVVLPGSGGAHVLVPAEAGVARSLGTALLPAGRRRWRLLAQVLAKEPGSTLIDRCGRPEVLVASRPDPDNCALAPLGSAHVAMAEGVPGPLAKRVVAMHSTDCGKRSVLKQAMGSAAAAAVAQESRALRDLHGLGLAPPLIDQGGNGAGAWLVQGHVQGNRGPDGLDSRHGSFAGLLAAGRGGGLEYGALPGIRLARKLLARKGTDAHAERLRSALAHLESLLEKRFRRRSVPITYGHGDFTPWNLRTDGPQLVAFDWEFAEARMPMGFDLLHHVMQVGILVRRRSPEEVLADIPKQLDRAQGPDLGMCLEEAIGLAVLIASTRDMAHELLAPAQHEQAQWLRSTRTELALLVGLALAAAPQAMEQRRPAA